MPSTFRNAQLEHRMQRLAKKRCNARGVSFAQRAVEFTPLSLARKEQQLINFGATEEEAHRAVVGAIDAALSTYRSEVNGT